MQNNSGLRATMSSHLKGTKQTHLNENRIERESEFINITPTIFQQFHDAYIFRSLSFIVCYVWRSLDAKPFSMHVLIQMHLMSDIFTTQFNWKEYNIQMIPLSNTTFFHITHIFTLPRTK